MQERRLSRFQVRGCCAASYHA